MKKPGKCDILKTVHKYLWLLRQYSHVITLQFIFQKVSMNESFMSLSPWDEEDGQLYSKKIYRAKPTIRKINSCDLKAVKRQSNRKNKQQSDRRCQPNKQASKEKMQIIRRQRYWSNQVQNENILNKGSNTRKIAQLKINDIMKNNIKIKNVRLNADKYYGKKEVQKLTVFQRSIPLVIQMKHNFKNEKKENPKEKTSFPPKRTIYNMTMQQKKQKNEKKLYIKTENSIHVLDKFYSKY